MIVLVLVNSQYFIFPKLNKFKNNNKSGNFTFKVINDQSVPFLFPVNVFRPKSAAAGLPTNLRNVQLASFSRLYFSCLLDKDLKGQCR